MTYITRIANKRILAKYFLYSLQINYLHWKLSTSRSIFSCYATNTMSQRRQSDLMILHVHKDHTDKLNLMHIANDFIVASEQRLSLCRKF